MDIFKRVPSSNLTDCENVFFRQRPGSNNQTVLVPRSERELASNFGTKKFDFGGNGSRPMANEAYDKRVTGVGPLLSPQSVERDSPLNEFDGAKTDPEIHYLKHVADQNVAATPPRKRLDDTSNSSKKERSSFGGRYVIACATFALMAGVAAGGVLASKLISSSSMAMPQQQLAINQLNVITQQLSSLHQSMEELAARQQNIAEAQKALASEQARLATAQEQETLKPDHVPSGRVSRPSRSLKRQSLGR